MKLIHTADWHLGKIVNNLHMTEDQRFILNQFLNVVEEEKPDAIIIAGDLYDRSIPPREAVELLNSTLTKLTLELKIPVLAISGNHDSPDRLEFGSSLFRANHLYINTRLRSGYSPVTLEDDYGPVHFHLIPYIEPAEVREFMDDDTIQTHHQAMEAIVKYIESNYDMNDRHVWVGHSFLAGGMETESEERLTMVGGSPYVDASLFKNFSYVALGHLHQPQRVKHDHIRYSGSLLKYSFSEADQKKGVTVVELDEQGQYQRQIPLTPRRDLEIVEGYFDELLEKNLAGNHENYLHIRLLDDGQLVDPMGKLRKKYPNILRLERKVNVSQNQLKDLKKIKERQEMSHTELFASFYEEMKGEAIPEKRKLQMQELISNLMQEERVK
ncbi:exonuclease SbcCD subunit D [Thalassobacillus pellis]|uniref:exonuclease SbcCD subunit D n=1 Tax=Thalassobacillus pellis TaxID=748008 RepID=UPI0019616EC6|nr:exonuclease SbcCD subunit D [Thalassobacillus pellis]MBM7552534.1 exonuclease SbcD [Thalassobacillus pellis]